MSGDLEEVADDDYLAQILERKNKRTIKKNIHTMEADKNSFNIYDVFLSKPFGVGMWNNRFTFIDAEGGVAKWNNEYPSLSVDVGMVVTAVKMSDGSWTDTTKLNFKQIAKLVKSTTNPANLKVCRDPDFDETTIPAKLTRKSQLAVAVKSAKKKKEEKDSTSALEGEDPLVHGVFSLTIEEADRLKAEAQTEVKAGSQPSTPYVVVLMKPLGLSLYGNTIVNVSPDGGGAKWNQANPTECIISGSSVAAVLNDGEWIDTSAYAYTPLAKLLTSLSAPLQLRIAPEEA